jgi:hypothetical protein
MVYNVLPESTNTTLGLIDIIILTCSLTDCTFLERIPTPHAAKMKNSELIDLEISIPMFVERYTESFER